MNFHRAILIFVTIFCWAIGSENLSAQDYPQCQVIKKYPNGSYVVQIGDQQMLAITQNMEKKMLQLNRNMMDAERTILLKDSLLSNFYRTVAWYDTTIHNMKAYITELEEILNGYKGLLRDYKKMKTPWLTASWGIGATSQDYKPSVLMGLGIRNLMISGFMQERNSGLLVGTKFRLF
ncbi:MAG TPA: hypothetical protein ENN22_11825 [bacterium]|nr:hypothetical protein [bacterium]